MPKLYSKADTTRLVPAASAKATQEPYRSAHRRDYGRLVHCPAFRRLQGKTQLFPGPDSDFFRTRLSHSLEVAQIAKSIAIRINATEKHFQKNQINTDIVETAALAHDLGHPPFGHNGEHALDECMQDFGGFEGNAQTLRILTRLEKRQTLFPEEGIRPIRKGIENRAGLNLTYRTLAAVLKYDNEIPLKRNDRDDRDGVCKGYYQTEASIVEKVKQAIPHGRGQFRTVECCIMDIADDIAYSTYDLEDAFKAKFLSPVLLVAQPDEVVNKVVTTVKGRLDKYYRHLPASKRKFTKDDVIYTLAELFNDLYGASTAIIEEPGDLNSFGTAFLATDAAFSASEKITGDGYARAGFTSELVGSFIQGIEVEYNSTYPSQSVVRLNVETFKRVEVLKTFAYQSLIMSPRLKVAEHRGKQIIKQIFDTLKKDDGHLLMPDDARAIYNSIRFEANKMRVICDFIACMTDRYALQFYNRLFGTSHESIHAPL